MAVTPQKSRGTKFFIGTNSTALASESSWTQIQGAYASGNDIGQEWGNTDGTTFEDTVKQTLKTVADAGSFDLSMRLDLTDAGQTSLKAACADKNNKPYNFKIEMDDDKVSVGDNPTKFTFQVRVMSFKYGPGSTSSLYEAKAKIDLATLVTYTAAAA